LFVDEIHRFNKAQQDALLPHVEDGTVILIGATTENPSFEVNPALRSRTRTLVLRPLEPPQIRAILRRAITDTHNGLGLPVTALPEEVFDAIVAASGSDARVALANLEAIAHAGLPSAQAVWDFLDRKPASYDKTGESHYDIASAFIKSIRGSDPDAALYWLARMLDGGEDPLFIARRLVVSAAEDVGNAAPMGLMLATAAFQATQQLGMPEARIPLAQATIYLATAPKSNAAYLAIERALADVRQDPQQPVPLHLRNAVTGLLQSLDHGRGYRYPHDYPDAFDATQSYFPDGSEARPYYEPNPRGSEEAIASRLAQWRKLRST
ncbi:MAG: replication-associated recombination protein A, partial [Cyanobacteria bacterium REEB65]|nr:replication-associated recombination protein A [Cyanobacteria bacterium REEB65]